MAQSVLIIDDEKHVRSVLAESLAAAGFSVSEAESGEEALDVVRARAADLMIVDLKMPGISGLEFIRQVRDIAADSQVIILTGFGDMQSAVEALRLGAYDYLSKPVDLDRVLQTLRNAGERRRLLSENSELIRRLQEANQIKADFINGMSHEVRTPLGHITGFTQILQDTLSDPTDKQLRFLGNIQAAAEKLLGMFENILQFSTLKTGDVDLRLEEVPLAVLVGAAVDAARPAATEAGLTLRIDGDIGGLVRVDGAAVSKMLSLLLDNATKFTHAGGEIVVSAEATAAPHGPQDPDHPPPSTTVSGWLAIRVRDTGVGIAPEDQRRIFDLFQQAEGGLDRRYEGTGIGLPLALSLARFHGGTIHLDSTPGTGSTFTVSIPLLSD